MSADMPDRRIGISAVGASMRCRSVSMSDGNDVVHPGKSRQDFVLIRRTAYSTVGATHWTVVVIPRIFFVPTLPSALQKPSNV